MENNSSTGSGHGNNFFSGFLLGALVGAAVVFLFATKKGKRILKAISEKGADNISNILDKIDKSVDLPDESPDEESFTASENLFPKKTIVKDKPKTRRFFRGISRHVN